VIQGTFGVIQGTFGVIQGTWVISIGGTPPSWFLSIYVYIYHSTTYLFYNNDKDSHAYAGQPE
jgi:hypothetical protein